MRPGRGLWFLFKKRLFSKKCTLRTPWWNCYRTATASELLWSRRNVTGGRFSKRYQSGQSQTPYSAARWLPVTLSMTVRIRPTSKHAEFNQNNTTWPAKANQIDAKKMNVSAASLAPDSSVRKATPSDITERTARSGAVVETIFLSRPRRAQCTKSGEKKSCLANCKKIKICSQNWQKNGVIRGKTICLFLCLRGKNRLVFG